MALGVLGLAILPRLLPGSFALTVLTLGFVSVNDTKSGAANVNLISAGMSSRGSWVVAVPLRRRVSVVSPYAPGCWKVPIGKPLGTVPLGSR